MEHTEPRNLDDTEYEGAITLVMPGQVKPSTYRIRTKAPDRVTALALIQDTWREKMDDIAVAVSKVKPGSPANAGEK